MSGKATSQHSSLSVYLNKPSTLGRKKKKKKVDEAVAVKQPHHGLYVFQTELFVFAKFINLVQVLCNSFMSKALVDVKQKKTKKLANFH